MNETMSIYRGKNIFLSHAWRVEIQTVEFIIVF